MNGLLELQRQATLAASRHRELAASCGNPREAAIQINAANQEASKAGDLAARIETIESIRIDCGSLAARLRQLAPSAHTQLALRHIEDAESRLVRELGN